MNRFTQRLLKHCGPFTYRRFIKHCKDYIEAVAREADLREHGTVLDVDAYVTLRRENSAVRLCCGLAGYALGIDLTDQVVIIDEAHSECVFPLQPRTALDQRMARSRVPHA